MGVRVWRISFIVFCCFFIIVQQSSVIADSKNDEHVGEKKASVTEMVKNLLTIPTASPFTTKYWGKVKTLLDQGRSYLPSPNLDFRKVDNAAVNGEGIGERIKEAALRSVGKSKGAIEDSAEKTGKVVGEAAKRLRRTSTTIRKDDQSEL